MARVSLPLVLVGLVLWALPIEAQAMPQLLGGLLYAVTGNAWVAFFGSLLANAFYGDRQRKKAQREMRERRLAGISERTISVLSSEEPWHIVVGRCTKSYVTGAVITSGAIDEYKTLVAMWAAHRCDGIEDLQINGQSIGAVDAGGNAVGTRWGPERQTVVRELVTVSGSGLGTTSQPIVSFGVGTTEGVAGAGSYRGQDLGAVPLPASHLSSVTGSSFQVAAGFVGRHSGRTYWVQYAASALFPALRVKHYLGLDDQVADSTLVSESIGGWTSSDRLRGITYSLLRMDLAEPEFQLGPPAYTATLRGLLCYDPRLDSTRPGGSGPHRVDQPDTYAWTRNNALIVGRFLMAEWGKRASASAIDWASVATAANACDEPLVSQGGAPRYTCDGSWKTDRDPDDVLEALCLSMAGYCVFDGIWTVVAGIYTAPVADLDDEDNAGALEIEAGPTGDRLFNGVRGRFYDPGRLSQFTDYTPYSNAAYVTEDKRPIWSDEDFEFTNAAWRCRNIARILVERERGQRIQYPAKAWAVSLKPGQRVRLTSRFPVYSAAVFRVVRRRIELEKGRVMLTLQQDDPSHWDEADATGTLTSPVQPRDDPFVVEPVASLLATSNAAVSQRDPAGNVIGNVRLTYAASTNELVLTGGALQVEFRAASEETWVRAPEAPGNSTACDLPLLRPRAAYMLRARWRNSLGVPGEWRTAPVVVADTQTASRGSLISSSSWVVGTTGSQGDFKAAGLAAENSIALAVAPDGVERPTWTGTDANSDFLGDGGGWNDCPFPVDPSAMYRLAAWVQVATPGPSGPFGLGTIYLGCSTFGGSDISDIGGGVNSNPYHLTPPRATLATGRWYLMVGYIFPTGYAGAQLNRSGLYEGLTGKRVASGTDFRWSAAATAGNLRCFQYYAGLGAVTRFWGPRVDRCDGLEPTLDELLAPARIGATAWWITRSAASIRRSVAGVFTPVDLTVSAIASTASDGPQAYEGRFTIAANTGSGFVDVSISSVDESSRTWAVAGTGLLAVRVRLYMAGGFTTLLDEEIIPVVDDGATGLNGISAVLGNSAHVLPADAAGAVTSYAGSGTTLQVSEGSTALTFHTTLAAGRFTIGTPTVSPGGALTVGSISGSGSTTATVAEHSGASAGQDVIVVSYPVTVRRASGSDVSFTVRQGLTKGKRGAQGDPGSPGGAGSAGTSVYAARIFAQQTTAPSAPTGGTFNFSTGVLTPPSGWTIAQPSTSFVPTFAADFVFSTTTPGSTVTAGTWSTPTLIDRSSSLPNISVTDIEIALFPPSATADFRFTTDGKIQRSKNNGASWTETGIYHGPTGSGVGSDYWIFVERQGGSNDLNTGAAQRTWLRLDSERRFGLIATGSPVDMDSSGEYLLATDSTGDTIIGRGIFYLRTIREEI
jgi:hypothetical protein